METESGNGKRKRKAEREMVVTAIGTQYKLVRHVRPQYRSHV